MRRYDDREHGGGKRGSTAFWIFVAILAFPTLFYPFFGGTFKYQIGSMVDIILTKAGQVLFVAGVLLMIWGIFSLLCRGGLRALRPMIIGFLLIVLAGYMINPGFFAFITHGDTTPKGYY